MNRTHWLPLAGAIAFFPLLLSGCADSIHTYEVPYVNQRLLGAIVENEQGVWFFKVMGKADDVAEQKDKFNAFVHSLKFPGDGKLPVSWKAPEGWDYEAGKEGQLRFGTFRLPNQLEVTVFKFGPEANQVLPNVNRWRGQLNLDPINIDELRKVCKREKLEGDQEAFVVDMESARYAPIHEPKPPVEAAGMPPEAGGKPFDYKLPPGWKVKDNPGAMAIAAFAVEQGGKQADVTITPLRGGGGDISANINRWRGQVGLPAADEDQLRKDSKVIQVDGKDSVFVALVGPQGKSILAAICPGGNQTWFVKMMGDADLVARQKSAFDDFLAGLKFRGGQ